MYWLGLDLGQAQDPSALAIIQDVQEKTGLYTHDGREKYKVFYHVIHLQRYPLGTNYPQIVRELTAVVHLPVIVKAGYWMFADQTGVGAPVVDMLQEAGFFVRGIVITGGNQPGEGTLPKRDIISAVQVLLQAKRLLIAAGTLDAETLVQEMLNYRVKIDPETAHDSYNAREGKHDDLLLALGLAAYYAKQTCGWGNEQSGAFLIGSDPVTGQMITKNL